MSQRSMSAAQATAVSLIGCAPDLRHLQRLARQPNEFIAVERCAAEDTGLNRTYFT